MTWCVMRKSIAVDFVHPDNAKGFSLSILSFVVDYKINPYQLLVLMDDIRNCRRGGPSFALSCSLDSS